MSTTVRPVIEIVSHNRYLEVGLRAIVDEMEDSWSILMPGDIPLKIVLIDIRNLDLEKVKDNCFSLALRVLEADRYAFISSSEVCFDDVPHLAVHRSLDVVRSDLKKLLNVLIENKTPHHPMLFSRLNDTQRQVMNCLVQEYSIEDIHRLLRRKKKNIYNVRKQLMRKYNMMNRNDLRHVLRAYDFMKRLNIAKTQPFVDYNIKLPHYWEQKAYEGGEIYEI